jgi:hypothetical protein
MRKLVIGGVIVCVALISAFALLIIGHTIRNEIQINKILSNFSESSVTKKYLSNGVFREDLECYPETGTTVLKMSCIGISYDISDEVCQKLKSELLSKNEQCGAYEWLETSFKNKRVQFMIENSSSKEGKTVTFLVE